MTGRSHQERLIGELKEIREELSTEVGKLRPEEFDSSPKPEMEMKTCKGLLREIGTMEKISVGWLAEQTLGGWESAVSWSGDTAESTMADLAAVRAETLAYLNGCSEEKLQTPIDLPKEWYQYFNGTTVEPEELLRWVGRHEYYHLGQLIIYRWIWGDNPYKPAAA